MEDPRFLRIILFGLILAGLTIGYLIFTGRFIKPQQAKTQTITQTATPTPIPIQIQIQIVASPSPFASATPSPIPSRTPVQKSVVATPSAYARIADRTQNKVTTLPKTGLPTILIGVASLSAIISGWFLRNYPE